MGMVKIKSIPATAYVHLDLVHIPRGTMIPMRTNIVKYTTPGTFAVLKSGRYIEKRDKAIVVSKKRNIMRMNIPFGLLRYSISFWFFTIKVLFYVLYRFILF